jgi:cell division protein FtsZ
MAEVSTITSAVSDNAHEDANIIFGTVVDETLEDQIRVTVIATGFEKEDV